MGTRNTTRAAGCFGAALLLASGCTSVTKISEPGQTPVLEFQVFSLEVRLPTLAIDQRETKTAETAESTEGSD